MTPQQRIEALIQHLGLNVKSFSELCGYERPQILYDIIKGKTRNISASVAERITEAVPDINRMWLLTGQGDMITEPLKPATISDNKSPNLVPLIPVSAIAGPLKVYFEGGISRRDCPLVISPVDGADMAMQISGDSMEPSFPDGSYIFIKRINEHAFIPWGHPLVLDTENGAFFKNVLPDNDDTTYIWCNSINPKYPPMHVPTACVYGMYRVLNVSKSFTTM